MRTIKQVSDLTGVSVRMLHYYDQIGLLCPTKTTAAGYRLYDDAALETLQQILFFKCSFYSLSSLSPGKRPQRLKDLSRSSDMPWKRLKD